LLRCFSLICSTICIYLGTWIVLHSLQSQVQANVPWNIGAAVLIIATTPLIVAQGDSIRWYPMFAAVVFLAFRCEARGKLWHSAALAGIGFSINLMGILIYGAMVALRLWTHLKNRTASARVIAPESAYGLCFAVSGILGFASLLAILAEAPDSIAVQFTTNPFIAIGQASLGLIGGYSLGILAGLPVVAAYAALFLYAAWGQRYAIATIAFVLVPSFVPVLIVFAGFARPRAFLFLAVSCSMLLAVSVLYATGRRALAIAGIAVVIHLLVLANRSGTIGVFKRNLAIPYEEISEFVAANLPGDGALITTDDVVAYTLLEGVRSLCVALEIRARCLQSRHGVIITITGEPDLERQLRFSTLRGRAVGARRLRFRSASTTKRP
jgi:hypothetical protein